MVHGREGGRERAQEGEGEGPGMGRERARGGEERGPERGREKGKGTAVEKAGEVGVGGGSSGTGVAWLFAYVGRGHQSSGSVHVMLRQLSLRRWTGRRSPGPPLPTVRRLPRTSPLFPFLACLNNQSTQISAWYYSRRPARG